MKPLSVNIPCYNCADTLEEAVASIYRQGLRDFEIVMVDDGSTDGTRGVMECLAKEHPEIRLFFHEKNKGGGAARNTAIRSSKHDLIYCLDSDNMLGSDSLSRMVAMQEKTGADGISVGRSTKFVGHDTAHVSSVNDWYNGDAPIGFESLFEDSPGKDCGLYSTFLHTKRAFEITGGYPEHHGFDTQGFAFRFLCNGLVARACKDAGDFHRVKYGQSYYIREHAAGRVSLNWYLVYAEFMYLFSESAKEVLLSARFDDHDHPLSKKILACKERFAPEYKSLIVPYAKKAYRERIARSGGTNPYDDYWLGEESLLAGDFIAASGHFLRAINGGLDYPRACLRLLTTLEREQTGQTLKKDIAFEGWISDVLDADRITPPLKNSDSLWTRATRKISRKISGSRNLKI